MPGWMGMRGLESKSPRDMERERRNEQRPGDDAARERRSMEKVQEILRDQQGDMSAYTGAISDAGSGDCARIQNRPVSDIMSGRVAVLSFDDNLLTVQGIFASVKFRHLPIVDEDGRIIGIISDRDLLRIASPFFGTVNEQKRDREIMTRKVGTIMTRNPVCATLDTPIVEAIRMINRRKISCLPIIEKGSERLLGIITWKDAVRAFCPGGFNRDTESQRLKAGVQINPESSESARLRAKASESARLSARPGPAEAGAPAVERRRQPPVAAPESVPEIRPEDLRRREYRDRPLTSRSARLPAREDGKKDGEQTPPA